MTVLSRQGIIEYMERKEDPLKVYTVDEKGKCHSIPESQINANTVELCIGTKVGELDLHKLEEELDYVFPLDRKDYIYLGGINPDVDRKPIEKSTRILDLNKLDDFVVEKEEQGDKDCYSYKVKTKDGYVFSTRIKKKDENDKKASGIILHPEIYYYRLLSSSMTDVALTIGETIGDVERYLISKQNQSLAERLKHLQIRDKQSPKILEKINRDLADLMDRVRSPNIKFPSSKFTLVWTNECLHVPLDLCGEIGTKSKFARLGGSSHLTSPDVHPGYQGNLALELENSGENPLTFFVDQHVAEIKFLKLDKPVDVGYSQDPKSTYKKDRFTF